MKKLHINLKGRYPNILNHDVFLDAYLYEDSFEYPNAKRKSVLVLPGGGYDFISVREKDPIMFAFLACGFNAFSLSYSCHTSFPIPHLEVWCAMKYINSHAKEYRLIPNTTSLIGFSAGGHLAATYAYLYQSFCKRKSDLLVSKPYALVLAYPVISLIKSNNLQTTENISHYDESLMHLLSADEHVSKDYPPTFIWTTKTDTCVNPDNVKWLSQQLKKQKVKNQCIIYTNGPHGLSLANEATANGNPELINPAVATWLDLAVKFINNLKE